MKTKILTFILTLSVCSLAVAQPRPGTADDYPNRTVRIVVPFPPGAISDNTARVVGQKLAESFKQPVIVENKPGGGTIIGTDYVAKSPADGYTILLSSSANAVTGSLYDKLPFDPIKSFAPVSLALTTPYVVVVNSNFPAKTFKELIALAKSKSVNLAYASAGNGSGTHLIGEMIKQTAGIDILHVPYNGSGPAMTDLLGGQVQVLYASYLPVAGHIKSGRLRLLAVTGKGRLAQEPDVPTVAESGFPNFDAPYWIGFSVPAGTPRPIVDKLSREIGQIMRTPDVREAFRVQAIDVVGSTPDEFSAFFAADAARWASVVKSGNIKP